MSLIKIRLRLYLPHDMDLISLMISHEMDIVQAMYCAVSAFVKHDSFAITIPPLRDVPMEKQRVFHRNLVLDSEKDKEVVDLLECIEPGYRNNFLKNILRLYIYCPATEAFLTNPEDMSKFAENFEVFTEGKRKADAASLKPRKRKSHQKGIVKPTTSQINKSENTIRREASVITPQEPIVEQEEIEINTYQDAENNEPVSNQSEEDLTDLFSAMLI